MSGWKIGVDGGATKTECILVDPAGAIASRHRAAGCNPNLVGPEEAGLRLREALRALRASHAPVALESTLLCMAGSRAFWAALAAGLDGFGRAVAGDDSLPVLELATRGKPGLVLHAGTGSFVAARTADGGARYAGGLGWRFGDEGSGYDLGKRAIARTLLELQGWLPPSRLGERVRERTKASTAGELAGNFYGDAAPNARIAAFAPDVLRLAAEGEAAAAQAVSESIAPFLQVAIAVAGVLGPDLGAGPVRAGVSGRVLNHPFAFRLLEANSPFALAPVTEAPIEGVRLLLQRGF